MTKLEKAHYDLDYLMKQLGMDYAQFENFQSKNHNQKAESWELPSNALHEIFNIDNRDNLDESFSTLMSLHPLHEYHHLIYVHLLISNAEATSSVIQHFHANIREYMDYYKNEFKDTIYIESLNPEQIIPIKILECVVSYALEKDSTIEKFIYDLIKKNNRSIFNQVKNVADSKSFLYHYSNYLDKRIARLKESEYLPFMLKATNEFMAAYLFCLRHDLILYTDGDESNTLLNLTCNTLSEYEIDLEEEQEAFQKVYIEPNHDKYSKIKKLHNIDITKPTIIRDLMLKMLKIEGVQFDHTYFKLFVNLTSRSTHFDMNPRDLFHQAYITPAQINMIVHQYHEIESLIGESEINLQFREYIVIQLAFITILNEYKKIKNAFTGYLEESFEQLALVYENENQHKAENELNQKVSELQSEHEQLQSRIKQLEAQLKDSELQQKRLEKELEGIQPKEELLSEVHALREYMYLHNEAGQVAEVNNYDQALLTLKNKDILLVGGHTNMTNKLKELIPSIDIFNIEQLGKSQSFSKYEHVFIYWSICNHAAYNKTLTQISQSKGKLHYLSGTTNIELVTREMYRSIME